MDSLVFIEYCIEEFLNLEKVPNKNINNLEENKSSYDNKYKKNNENENSNKQNEQNDSNMSNNNENHSNQTYTFENLKNELEREKFQKSQVKTNIL